MSTRSRHVSIPSDSYICILLHIYALFLYRALYLPSRLQKFMYNIYICLNFKFQSFYFMSSLHKKVLEKRCKLRNKISSNSFIVKYQELPTSRKLILAKIKFKKKISVK